MLGITGQKGQRMLQDRQQGRQILDSPAGTTRQIHHQRSSAGSRYASGESSHRVPADSLGQHQYDEARCLRWLRPARPARQGL